MLFEAIKTLLFVKKSINTILVILFCKFVNQIVKLYN